MQNWVALNMHRSLLIDGFFLFHRRCLRTGMYVKETTFNRFTCSKIAVLLNCSFGEVPFFADLCSNKGFLLAKSPFFCLSQQKEKRSRRT